MQLVQDMFTGVKQILAHELAMTPVEDQEVGRHLKKVEELTGFPIFPAGTKSLLSKFLTKEIYQKLHEAKDKHGFQFKAAIFSGC